jgi:NADPH:quinone reductase-like Zn-dependent oxidoreductase
MARVLHELSRAYLPNTCAVGGIEMTILEASSSAIPRTMRAAVYEKFGGPEVVRVAEIATPTPAPTDLLVRVAASTVSVADHRMRARDLPPGLSLLALPVVGLFRPRRRVLGMDFSGTVVTAGTQVTKFQPGDEIVGMTGSAFGGHAEYLVVAETAAIGIKPRTLSHEDAVAMMFGGHTISECLRRCPINVGDEVLVNGASGAVGTSAVQIAKHFGARVTAITSAGNFGLVRSLGADRVVDYAKEDFASSEHRYDIVFDCVGNAPFDRVDRVLKSGGALLQVVADLKAMLTAKANSRRSGKRVIPINFTPTSDHVSSVLNLHRDGAVAPVVDRSYWLPDVVEAHRYVDTGRKRGSVVLRIAPAVQG